MKDTYRVRIGALLGIGGAVLWFIAVLVQQGLALQAPGTPGYAALQALYALAFLGILGSILGLRWSGAAGSGRFATIATGIYVAGMVGFVLSAAISTVTGNEDIPIAPFAALITNIGALLTGIAVLRARQWGNWQRFAPLLVFGYSVFGFILPAIITGQEPSVLALFVFGIPWLLQGLAVYTCAQALRAPALA
jgi:hypothetical protein